MDITHYVHPDADGGVSVMDAARFVKDGGLTQGWGRLWFGLLATSRDHARRKGAELFASMKHDTRR